MRITSKGQITIPQQVRRELGLQPGDEVEVVVQEGLAHIVPSDDLGSRGQRAAARLWGAGDVELNMTTDEIMALMRGDD